MTHDQTDDERPGLGLLLTGVQVSSYLGFVALCCFHDGFVSARASLGGIPVAFLAGLAVIALGTLLTIAYVKAADRAEVTR